MGVTIRSTVIRSVLLSIALIAVAIFDTSPANAVTAALDSTSPKSGNSFPDGIYQHRIRFNQLGEHNDVKLDIYMDTNTQKTIRINEIECLTNLNNGVLNTEKIVRVTMQGLTNPPPITISARDLCNDPANGLFRTFTLPLPKPNPLLQKLYVSLTIEYINVDKLNKINTSTNRNAIGFTVNVTNDSTAKVAPVSTGGRNYSVLAKSTTGSSSFRLPFALPCGTVANGSRKSIIIYDADVNDLFGKLEAEIFKKGTQEAVPLFSNIRTKGTIVGGEGGKKFIAGDDANNKDTTEFDFVPVSGQKYVLKISNLYNGNTIDIGMPNGMDTIYGAIPCPSGDLPEPPRSVTMTPYATISQSAIEPGEQTSGSGYAVVENFPDRYAGEWPSTGVAVQNANAANIAPNQVTYDANSTGATGDAATILVRCASGGYNANCARYRCANGTNTADNTQFCGSQGGRQWKCDWTNPNNGVALPSKYVDSRDQPNCAIVQYQCRNESGDWANRYKDWANQANNGCNNRWNCPSPSQIASIYAGSQPGGNVCKLFYCQVPTDAGQPFYDGNGDPRLRCDFRCANGGGDHAINAQAGGDGKWGAGDLQCYVPPSFTINCAISDGLNTVTVSETVGGNGTYCSRSVTIQGPPNIGGSVCATTSITSPANGAAWPGPGNAFDPDQPWYFSVAGPDSDCVNVVSKPTFKVFGGDVSAGSTFASMTCTNDFSNSSIVGWPGSATGYNGSYTEYGAFASGSVFGFASSKRQGNVPSGLTFANTSVSGERFGGDFGPMPCITNHMALKPADAQVMSSLEANRPSGSYQFNSSNINTSPTIGKGKQFIIYRTGDLNIDNNISYDRSSWATLDDIPALKVVVKGDIFIGPGVTELNGVYVAQPRDDGSGGRIFTCAGVANIDSFTNCDKALTINGAFIAKRVVLGRSFGTQRQGTTAEIFRYLPELWLTKWPQAGSSNSIRYDSMTNLAPVL